MFICVICCSIGIFLNTAHLICRSTDISKCSEFPFDFEITRVDCSKTAKGSSSLALAKQNVRFLLEVEILSYLRIREAMYSKTSMAQTPLEP